MFIIIFFKEMEVFVLWKICVKRDITKKRDISSEYTFKKIFHFNFYCQFQFSDLYGSISNNANSSPCALLSQLASYFNQSCKAGLGTIYTS